MKKSLLLPVIIFATVVCTQAQTKKELQQQIINLKNETGLLQRQVHDKDSAIMATVELLTEIANTLTLKQQQITHACKTLTELNNKNNYSSYVAAPAVSTGSTNVASTPSSAISYKTSGSTVRKSSSGYRTTYTGSRGGKYYINSKGNKIYIKKK